MSKILFHHNCLEQGGAERVISYLSNRFSENGDEVIVATEWQGENEFELNPNVRRIHVGLSEADESKNRFIKIWIRVFNLRKLIKKEKTDVVLGFTKKPLFRSLMACMGVNVPVIVAVRADPWFEYSSRGTKASIRFLMPRADGAVFQTKLQQSFFPEYLQKKSVIILNPIYEKYFIDSETFDKEKLIISTGRLVKSKNFAMMFRAFLRVHEEFPDYSLELFGEDSFDGTKEELEKIIADNHAESYIRLMGGSNQLEKEVPRAEIFVFPSDTEGMPNSLLEAMCMGMPVIATDCPAGGPATIIEDGKNGLLTPVKDEDAFTEAMLRLLRDRELAEKMGQNAKQLRDITKGDAIVKYWRDYIDEVIAKR